MKSFVIALPQISESMDAATLCIASGKLHSIDIELFEGIFRDVADEVRIKENVLIKDKTINTTYSRAPGVIGCFMSHFMLWKKCIELNESILILEHDAVIHTPIPQIDYGYAINVGKPSYAKYQAPTIAGVYPLFSRVNFPGTHAYICTPTAANDFVNYAKSEGMLATDVYLAIARFPKLVELYPWPVHVEETFSTIQKELGAVSKHMHNKDYKLI